ncbi:SRPBCC family protein [Flavobacterium flavigenum]|uniref:SRPBCC family protein n=1 Tax=Flavobacterium flavigenum TaxID=3003258 RepID=UPI0032C46B89
MTFDDYFVDEMEEGKFKTFKHEHFFKEINGVTIMTDQLHYETPFGIIGKLFDTLFLKKHLIYFLLERNKTLKKIAENK